MIESSRGLGYIFPGQDLCHHTDLVEVNDVLFMVLTGLKCNHIKKRKSTMQKHFFSETMSLILEIIHRHQQFSGRLVPVRTFECCVDYPE